MALRGFKRGFKSKNGKRLKMKRKEEKMKKVKIKTKMNSFQLPKAKHLRFAFGFHSKHTPAAAVARVKEVGQLDTKLMTKKKSEQPPWRHQVILFFGSGSVVV